MPPFNALIQTALLGTDRRPLPATVSAALQLVPAEDPAQTVLEALATSLLLHKAGYLLPDAPTELPHPAPPDERPVCQATTLRHLEQIRSGQFADALPEWLELLARHNLRLPPEILPELLHAGLENRALIKQIQPALGPRGEWLAALHLRWQSLLAEPDWHTGTFPERLQWLTALRRQDPEQALTALAETWPKERPNHRVKLLETLAIGSATGDHPFLLEAAADKNSDVQLMATRLLHLFSLSPQEATTLLTCYRDEDLPKGLSVEIWPERFRYSLPWHTPGVLAYLPAVLPALILTISRFGFYEKSTFVQSVILPACYRCDLAQLNTAFTQLPESGELPLRCRSIVQFRAQMRRAVDGGR